MNCEQVRRILWPADVLRAGDDRIAAALEHADRCGRCRHFVEHDRRVARFIRDTVQRVQAPRELRERLFTALARERAGQRTSSRVRPMTRRWAVGAAAIVLVALLAGVSQFIAGSGAGDDSPSAATAFAEDYLRRVVEQATMQTPDRTEIARFFDRQLGEGMTPPEIPGFQADRALICLLNGRRGGVVEYHRQDRHLAHYIVPVSDDPVAAASGLDVREVGGELGAIPALNAETRLAVATWWDGVHQHALVGNLSVAELRQLAEQVAHSSSRL